MDKTAIRKFAVGARVKLLDAVAQKAYELGITEDDIQEVETYEDGFLINQKFYQQHEIKQREQLMNEVKQKGYAQVIEEVAYTWFNRFIALRFMEVNDYLPTGIRIFSSIELGKREPDALTEVLMLMDDLDLDEEIVYAMQDANETEELYKYILIKQCNKLGDIMPMMFEQIEDYTELLLPNQLLAENAVIHDMVTTIDEADWTKEVEIIGWLYQYYISEKKDEVFAGLKKNEKISKENIPAATELFTPRWIVQYMVDNSLGRYWLESHPDGTLQESLPYYVEAAEQPEHVKQQLEALKNPNIKPETIKFLDPCMGSGHILVYAFEVFYEIYKTQGYRERDIPRFIMEHNLYGLDIDPRAVQLAYFSVLMKARSYQPRIFQTEIMMNLHWIEESNAITAEEKQWFTDDGDMGEDLDVLLDTFMDGKLYGSIIEVPELDLVGLKTRAKELKEKEMNDMFAIDFKDHTLPVIEHLIDQAILLREKYEIVVTNPPYMGRKGMNAELSKYVKKHYKDSSADLYAVFMEVASKAVKDNGFLALINQHSWMFLSSFEKLRKKMLLNHQTYSMAHLGTRAFAEIGGEVVQTTAFVMRENTTSDYEATFIRLTDYNDAEEKAKQFCNKELYYNRTQDGFADIPGSPIAYWASKQVRKVFKNCSFMEETATPRAGLATGNNNIFQRYWSEVSLPEIGFNYESSKETNDLKYKWFPCETGGVSKKWYGNKVMVVNWFDNGKEVKSFRDDKGKQKSRPQNVKFYFKKGITWNKLSTNNFAVRFKEKGSIFDDTSRSAFPNSVTKAKYILGLLTTKISTYFMSFLNPTLSFTNGDIKRIPVILRDDYINEIDDFVDINISLSKSDWDSFETSWDFQTHPFLEFKQDATTMSAAFHNWELEAGRRFQTLKSNEEELNQIFIELYGLEDELTPEVEEKDVTVSRADQLRDVKSFISYSVGVMFGRYSLDEPGLIYAGGAFEENRYQAFTPDVENVIPITDDTYFEDDIAMRFIDFLSVTFGEAHLEENLDFIADSLTKRANETARQRIRRYFLKEFYKDHVKMYQKRPIYWLFDSGKQDGFKALVYLHRYEPGLVARVRIDYLHAQQKKYEEEIERLDMMLAGDISKTEQTRARKQKETLQKQILECQQYDQVIAHMAHQQLDLDLDDGVKVNYAKFQNIEIPQGEDKKPLKGNVLSKI